MKQKIGKHRGEADHHVKGDRNHYLGRKHEIKIRAGMSSTEDDDIKIFLILLLVNDNLDINCTIFIETVHHYPVKYYTGQVTINKV